MQILAQRIYVLITTLWVGSIWAIGYVVAPVLFATLHDKVLAGTIAGKLFYIEAWLSVGCFVVLMMLQKYFPPQVLSSKKKYWFSLMVGMLLCTIVGYFGLHPFMASLREAAGPMGVMASEAKMQFGILHGLSSGIYLIKSLLGMALVLQLYNFSSRLTTD